MGIADLPRPVGYVLGGGWSLGAVQVGMLQALSEHDIAPDIVTGTSVGSLNGAVVALDPASAANRLSHLWARITRDQVFPGGLLAQVRTLQHSRTHLFPSTGLAAVIAGFLGTGTTFAELTLPFAALAMDVATARPHVLRALAAAHGDDRGPGLLHVARTAYTASMAATFMISAIGVLAAALLAALLMRNTSPAPTPTPAEEQELVA